MGDLNESQKLDRPSHLPMLGQKVALWSSIKGSGS